MIFSALAFLFSPFVAMEDFTKVEDSKVSVSASCDTGRTAAGRAGSFNSGKNDAGVPVRYGCSALVTGSAAMP
jgi:hypothetical protein